MGVHVDFEDDDLFADDYEEDEYEYLEDEYSDLVGFEPIGKPMDPEGSMTDNARLIGPQRNGAHKRNREAQRRMKEFNPRTRDED